MLFKIQLIGKCIIVPKCTRESPPFDPNRAQFNPDRLFTHRFSVIRLNTVLPSTRSHFKGHSSVRLKKKCSCVPRLPQNVFGVSSVIFYLN